MEPRPRPPDDVGALMVRAQQLAGRSVSHTAQRFGLPVPAEMKRHKGWLGQLLEYALGASAASRAEPDFPHLAVELKTVPVGPDARPKGSTYVCVARLDGAMEACWEESWVRRKLARVLFVPIVGDGDPGDRIIGAPIFWEPDATEDARLRADWEEITERIVRGDLRGLHARAGEILQLRPKGATSADVTWTMNEDAEWVETMPRGFYLRRTFTAGLFARAFGVG